MDKTRYKNLLETEYWKGYSYSIIKERNFTCEDCGRSFPGERNKLHVHHLVYHGDIAPWSYKPEEVIILCHECHEKRHGIYRSNQYEEKLQSVDNIKTRPNIRREILNIILGITAAILLSALIIRVLEKI